MSGDKTEIVFFGELQIHVTAYANPSNRLVITIFLPDEEKGKPYDAKIPPFIGTVLRNEGMTPRVESAPVDTVRQSGTVYTRNVYNLVGYPSERMYKSVGNAFKEAERIFHLRGGFGSEFTDDGSKIKIFDECLKEALPLPRAVPYQSFEQKLWEEINGTIRDHNNKSPQKVNEMMLSRRLVALAISKPHFTLSDVTEAIKTSTGTIDAVDPSGILAVNLKKIMGHIRRLWIEKAVKEALDKFNGGCRRLG